MAKKQKNDIELIEYSMVIIGAGQTGMSLAKMLMRYDVKILLLDEMEPGIKSSLDIKLFTFLANKYKGIETKKFLSLLSDEMEQAKVEANEPFNKKILEGSTVDFLKGKPKVLSNNTIEVNGQTFKFKKLIFATGSYYKDLVMPGLTPSMYIDPGEIGMLEPFVETVAIYGSDWAALELGQALTKVGIKVYFVDSNVNPFDDFDDEVEATLKKQFKNDLMSWCLETTVVNHEVTSDTTIRITLKTDSIERSIEVNKIITTKKSPNTLSVEAPFELHKNKSGAFIISSSFQMKEKNNFYAIGDVNGLHLYPNQGYHQAFTLAQNFLEKLSKLDVYNFAFSLNVDPSISFYGMNKSQIEYSQMPYNEFMYEFKNDFKVKSKGELGRIKVFTNHKHEILGALLIGDELSELINVFVVAKQNNIKFHKLAWLNIPFFTKSEFIRDAALEYYHEFILKDKQLKTKTKKFK